MPGALLSIVGLGALVYGIIEGPINGWTSPETLGTFAFAITVLALFGLREVTATYPMLDLHLFRDRRFSVASGGMTMIFFAMFGTFFIASQYHPEFKSRPERPAPLFRDFVGAALVRARGRATGAGDVVHANGGAERE